MGKVDPVETINTIYFEETRGVPYPIFMKCFDRLLENPPQLDPAVPSGELEPFFKAVCLALERGVSDPEGRGKDRREEFYEHIYPVWKDELDDSDFRPYEEILEGKVRERMERRRRESVKSKEEFKESKIRSQKRQARFEKVMEDALEASERGEQEVEGKEKGNKKGKRKIPVFKNIRALIAAFKKGKIELHFSDVEERIPCARYRLESEKVTVQLIQTDKSYYCVLNYPEGISDRDAAEDQILATTSELGYSERGQSVYIKKKEDCTLKIKIGGKSTYIACKKGDEIPLDYLVHILPKMHKDLVELISGLGLA